jgi:outer membrane receptor protein involved in Fe transport
MRTSLGSDRARLAEAMLNLPLDETVAVRLAGRLRTSHGYVDNLLGREDFNSSNMRAVRGAIRIEKVGFTLDLTGNYQRDRASGTSFKSMAFRPIDPESGVVIGSTRPSSGAALAAANGFDGGRPLSVARSVWSLTGQATITPSDTFSLTSISAWRRFSTLEVLDVDGLSLPLLTAADHARGSQASQELRLELKQGPFTVLAGAYYVRETGRQVTPAQFDERMLLALLTGKLSGPDLGRPATDPAPAMAFANLDFTTAMLRGLAGASGVSLSPGSAQAIAANLKPAHLETSTNRSRTTTIDLFADASWRLSPRLELGLGLRYSEGDKRTGYSGAVLNGRSVLGGFLGALPQPASVRSALLGALAAPGAATIPPSPQYPVPLFGLSTQPTSANGSTDTGLLKDAGMAWRLTGRYAPAEHVSLYGSYAHGRRPAVHAVRSPSLPFAPARFDRLPAETVDSYELGTKAALAARSLFLDASVFLYRYRNFQALVQQGTDFFITNAGSVASYGFEGQARWSLTRSLSLWASYAYNHSRFTTGAWDGNRLRLSPDHMVSLALMLDAPLGSGQVSFTPTLTYRSRFYFDEDNDRPELQQPPKTLVADKAQDEVQPGYALMNLRVGYQAPNNRWRAALFVDNLLDKKYLKDAGNTGDALGLPTFIAGKPRFYGVSASLNLDGLR